MAKALWPLAAATMLGLGASAVAQPAPSAHQNVIESRQYEQLLCTNPAFRARRIREECGPLAGSEFYSSCVASFACGPHRRFSNRPPPSDTTR